MAKNMDAYEEFADDLRTLNRKATVARRELKKIETRQAELRDILAKAMGKSTLANLHGEPAFEKLTGTRDGVTLERVRKYCDAATQALVIETKPTVTIKFL
ncbi:hypothetical protein SEA_NICEHOUSE_159 [Rhodococcus phage NiceHouse]|nr:hypothetical protein SEA_NICEHOUSE_159 [Rhodococcus phage NiceHouse]